MNPPPNPSPSNRRETRAQKGAALKLARRVAALAKQADVRPQSIMEVIGGLGLIKTFVHGPLSSEQRKQVFNEARKLERLMEDASANLSRAVPPTDQNPTNN